MNSHDTSAHAQDEFILIPLVALEDLPAIAAAKATNATEAACMARVGQACCDDSVRLAWALPILTGSVDALAEQRTLALAMALGAGLEGIEAIDVAIAATAPKMLSAPQPAPSDAAADSLLLDPWQEGVLMAASVLITCFDQPEMAGNILHELGLGTTDCSGLDEFDKTNLRKAQAAFGHIALRGLNSPSAPSEGAA